MIDPQSPDFENTPVSQKRPSYPYSLQPGQEQPVVSIVTPYYNTGEVFHQTAQSVLNQSLQQFEWLIVNDGSTDPVALRILEEYRHKDERIRVMDHPQNLGLSAARNTGVREARADYILFLDSDDLLEPTAAEKWWWFLLTHPQFGFVASYHVAFGGLNYLWTGGFHDGALNAEQNRVSMMCMVRKSVHEAVGGFDESIRGGLEDWEFWMRCASQGYWGETIPEYLAWYRVRGDHSDRWKNLAEDRIRQFRTLFYEKYPHLYQGKFPVLPLNPADLDLRRVDLNYAPVNTLAKHQPRLLLVLPNLDMDGGVRMTLNLMDGLIRQGWQISVVCTAQSDNPWLSEFAERTTDIFLLPNFIPLQDFPRFLGYFIASRKFDLLLLQGSLEGYRFLLLIRNMFPELLIVDYLHFVSDGLGQKGLSQLSLLYQEELDLTFVSSQAVRKWMVKNGASHERLQVCYGGVDQSRWQVDVEQKQKSRAEMGLSPQETLILFTAPLEEPYQPFLVAETAALLKERNLAFRILMVGDGSLKSSLQDKIQELGLQGRVNILGSVSPDQLQAVMTAADIFFFPAPGVGIPPDMIEAMSCEAVPVGAKTDGLTELVTMECGCLIDPASKRQAEEYAQILQQLIEDPLYRQSVGKSARQRVSERFTLEQMADTFLHTISSALRKHPRYLQSIAERTRWLIPAKEMARLTIELFQTQREVQRLQQAYDDLSRNFRVTRKSLEQQIGALQQQVTDLEAQNAHFTQELTSIFRSRSWRYTRPLRVVARFLGNRGFLPDDREVFLSKLNPLVSRLPFSAAVKSTLQRFVLKFTDLLSAPVTAVDQSSPRQLVAPPQTRVENQPLDEELIEAEPCMMGAMRPECCALEPGLVSVILPVYNQANFLKDSIESVLHQTYQNFELIVLNDGSTDDTAGVLEHYVRHPKIRLLTQQNQKLPTALSNAFGWARGEYWTWTSADNLMEPRHLEALVAKLQQNPEVGMVYADYYAIDDRGDLLKDPRWRRHNRPDLNSGEVRLPRTTEKLNQVPDNFIGPCFMYRGWIGRILGDYDAPQGVEDYDYWMRMNTLFTIRHLGSADLLYRYRVHDNTLNARAQEEKIPVKLQELMEEEKKRSAFFRQRVIYIADYLVADWLSKQAIPEEDVISIEQLTNPITETEKPYALAVSASNLQYYEGKIKNYPNLPLVIFFDTPKTTPYDVPHFLRRRNVLAVVRDGKTARRVRLIAPLAVIDREASEAIRGMNGFVKQSLFREITRPPSKRPKTPAEPLFVKNRAKSVLLQVDNFIQGGMENVVIDLAHTFEKSGMFQVKILVLGNGGEAVSKAKSLGLSVDVYHGSIGQGAYREYLLKNNIRLVNAHYSTFGAEVVKDSGVPFVQTIHNSYVWLEPAQVEAYRSADRCTTMYTCVSLTAAKYADLVLKLDIRKMKVVPNGIDSSIFVGINARDERIRLREEWRIDPHHPVFLNVASVLGAKAQLPLVEAFNEVVKVYPESRLVLLGATMETAYEHKVRAFVEEHDLADRVIFAGYDPRVAAYYYAADVFVLPSYWEGWSLSFGEAVYTGMPVVATKVGAALEFYDIENVLLVEPPYGDITSLNYRNLAQIINERNEAFISRLAQAMITAAKMPRVKPSEAQLARLERENAYKTYIDLYKALLG
jgi:glycosyltransferase involved in cell wall biosynthesis/glycogen synthase